MPTIADRLRGLLGNRNAGLSGSVSGTFKLGTTVFQAQAWTLPRVANAVYNNPTGYRCVELIANNLSRPDWQILKPGTDEPIDNHRLLGVLNKPAPNMSGTQLQRSIAIDLELTGRWAGLKMQGVDGWGEAGPVTGLRRLSPYRLTILGNTDDELLGFVYADRQGVRMPILPDNVVFLHYPNPERAYDGVAPALAAGLPAEIDNQAMQFNYNLLANDGAIPGYVTLKDMTPDQFKAWVATWQAGESPGKTRFIGGEATYTKVGQALALDTLLPTPTGWTTMGEIEEGTVLFDEQGQPCRVTFATEVMTDHQCYDVRFSDGTMIRADADHRWRTWDNRAMRGAANHLAGRTAVIHGAAVRTTAEIAADVAGNHRIEVAGPIDTPDVRLPIDPYVLGAWLGDGHSTSASIYGGVDLFEVMAEVERRGYPLGAVVTHASAKGTAWRQSFGIVMDGTGRVPRTEAGTAILRRMGMHRNKHIPDAYLRASARQRLDLLRGLMDTDGTIDERGHCRYSAKPEGLTRQVHELVASLGMRPTICRKADSYTVNFTPTMQPFVMARKAARYRPADESQTKWRVITSVTPAPSVPVRCIQVDSPSHLFLASRSFIPTHNTNQELAYEKLRDYSQHDISRSFGIPYVLVEPSDATFANMSEARAMFWQSTLLSKITLINDEMSEQLGTAEGVEVGQKLDDIDELGDAEDAIVDRGVKLLDRQVIVINEFRVDYLGMDPVPWGDMPMAPLLPMKPVAQAPAGAEPPPAVPAPAALPEATPTAPARNDVGPVVVKSAKVTPPDFERRVQVYEARMQRRMAAFFARQGRVLEAKLRSQSGKSHAKALQQDTWWDGARWDQELQDDLSSIYADTLDAFASDIIVALGRGTFDPNAEAIRNYILNRVQRDSRYINSTTADEVRQLIADTEAQGLGIAQIADAIKGYFAGDESTAAMRAERVARTEVIGAANYGVLQGAQMSGVATGKSWLTAGGGECLECASVDGEEVILWENFSNGLDSPPQHPQCRCTVEISTADGSVDYGATAVMDEN